MTQDQTAVEWLTERINFHKLNKTLTLEKLYELQETAKQMEKEQFNMARLDGINLANGGYGKKEDKTFKRRSLWEKITNK